jgi:hypothetical protein
MWPGRVASTSMTVPARSLRWSRLNLALPSRALTDLRGHGQSRPRQRTVT